MTPDEFIEQEATREKRKKEKGVRILIYVARAILIIAYVILMLEVMGYSVFGHRLF